MASPQEVEAFRIAIALTEGGGKIDYEQVNSKTGAYGAYQFLPGDDWEWYSTTAGYPGADIKDPAVQDAVARYWFNRNYNDFGSWELAAVAHFAGRTRAFTAKENGIEAVINLKDANGTNVGTYVDTTMSNYMKQKPKEDMKLFRAEEQKPTFYNKPVDATEIVNKEAATVLDAISTGMSNGGRKKLPISTQSDFEGQVPSQAGSFEATQIKSNIARQAMDKVSQYAQTVEQAFQQYLDAVNNG